METVRVATFQTDKIRRLFPDFSSHVDQLLVSNHFTLKVVFFPAFLINHLMVATMHQDLETDHHIYRVRQKNNPPLQKSHYSQNNLIFFGELFRGYS